MTLESFLPPVEKRRLNGFPFFGILPIFEYRYKYADTKASRDYLSHNAFPNPEVLARKQIQTENIITSEIGSILASTQLSFGLVDYLKETGVLMWGLSPRIKTQWMHYLQRLHSEIVIQLTVAHLSSTESCDDLSIKCIFRISKTHDDLKIPAIGAGSACYLNDIIALESPETLLAIAMEKCSYQKLKYSMAFIRDHYAASFFPKPLHQRLIFQQIRRRAVTVHSFTKPLL